eukprot:TRINITY_DN194_c0_g1_i1.p1 TRINITY_DN194_c0_g1~~TRINITY_DN194_c0_g1_i1.p1  ORF type:complete len:668 (-),score=204.53 TRINITY_DN194_c0_g1_i1:50-2053(-)
MSWMEQHSSEERGLRPSCVRDCLRRPLFFLILPPISSKLQVMVVFLFSLLLMEMIFVPHVALHIQGDGSHGGGVGEDGDASASNVKQEDRKIILLPKKQKKDPPVRRKGKGPGGMMFDDDSDNGDDSEEGGERNGDDTEESGSRSAKSLFGEKKKEREMDRLFEELKARHQNGVEPPQDVISPPTESSSRGFDVDDPGTTNIFVGHLSPGITEEVLLQEFGRFGDIGSVKVMWPRSDVERQRGHVSGFVCFMHRKDAEVAKREMEGAKILDFQIFLSWGKRVPVPDEPIFLKKAPRSSSDRRDEPREKRADEHVDGHVTKDAGDDAMEQWRGETGMEMESALEHGTKEKGSDKYDDGVGVDECVDGNRDVHGHYADSFRHKDVQTSSRRRTNAPQVIVRIPDEPSLVDRIHKVASYVLSAGRDFEEEMCKKEESNPLYDFLKPTSGDDYVYYRWKVWSMLQGDSLTEWKTAPFCMFVGGARWVPPACVAFESIADSSIREDKSKKTIRSQNAHSMEDTVLLSDGDYAILEDLLLGIVANKSYIRWTMGFCFDHVDCAAEIVDILVQSLSIDDTPLKKKLARLYLVSDILFNATSAIQGSLVFRDLLHKNLLSIFDAIARALQKAPGRVSQRIFSASMRGVLETWKNWRIFPEEMIDTCISAIQNACN